MSRMIDPPDDETLEDVIGHQYLYPDKKDFVDFLSVMITLRPEDRPRIALTKPLKHKWLSMAESRQRG